MLNFDIKRDWAIIMLSYLHIRAKHPAYHLSTCFGFKELNKIICQISDC